MADWEMATSHWKTFQVETRKLPMNAYDPIQPKEEGGHTDRPNFDSSRVNNAFENKMSFL